MSPVGEFRIKRKGESVERDIYEVAYNISTTSEQASLVDFDCKFFNHPATNKIGAVTNGVTLKDSNKMILTIPSNPSPGITTSEFGRANLFDVTEGKLVKGSDVCPVLGRNINAQGEILPLDKLEKTLTWSSCWEVQWTSFLPKIVRIGGVYTFTQIVNTFPSTAFTVLACGGGGAGGTGLEAFVVKYGGGGGGSAASGSVFIWVKKADDNKTIDINVGSGGGSTMGGVANFGNWFGGTDSSASDTTITYYDGETKKWSLTLCHGANGSDGDSNHQRGGAGGTASATANEYSDDYVYIKVLTTINGVAGRENRSSFGDRNYSGTLNKWNYVNNNYPFTCTHGDWKNKSTYGGPGAASAFGNGGNVKAGNGEAGGYGAGGAGGKGNGGHDGGSGGDGIAYIYC